MEKKHLDRKVTEPSCIKREVFLKDYSTMKVGGKSTFFFELKKESQCLEIADFILKNKAIFFILGGGSNTLFRDEGFEGVVIKNSLTGISVLKETKKEVYIEVASGESWDKLVSFAVNKKLFGIENLTSIPGTVGGAIVQNIGAYGVEVKESVYAVKMFDLKTKKTEIFKKDKLQFGYRTSVFKQKKNHSKIIISVIFKLYTSKKLNIDYKDLKEFFSAKVKKALEPKDVRKALQVIRGNKFPDLRTHGTLGSFFKNAVVKKSILLKVRNKFPEVVYFDSGNGTYKISTAWLIDKASGLKGFKEGEVGLFFNQSLVVVNFGNATAKEICIFTEKIKKIVFKKTGVTIEEEVLIV